MSEVSKIMGILMALILLIRGVYKLYKDDFDIGIMQISLSTILAWVLT